MKSDPMLAHWKRLIEVTKSNEKGFSWTLGREGLTVINHVITDGRATDELQVNIFGWDVLDKLLGREAFSAIRENARHYICNETGEISE